MESGGESNGQVVLKKMLEKRGEMVAIALQVGKHLPIGMAAEGSQVLEGSLLDLIEVRHHWSRLER